MTRVIGIDIGLTGAVGVVDGRGLSRVCDLPVLPDGKLRAPTARARKAAKEKGKKAVGTQPMRLSGAGLLEILREFVPPGETAVVVIEDIQARTETNGGGRGNTLHSQGSLMRSRGVVEAAVEIARLQLKVVRPQDWKPVYGLVVKRREGESDEELKARRDASKDNGRLKAIELFPQAAEDLKFKYHHNRADSLLLADFGLRNYV